MDKLVRNNEILLARNAVEKAGLYIANEKDLDHLAKASADAYQDYPLHNWFMNGTYDMKLSARLMLVTLKTMVKDALIYADSEEMNGFAVWLPRGFTGNKTLPFIMSGGLTLAFCPGPGLIAKLLTYESFAMGLKKQFTGHEDLYLYNLSVKKEAQGKGIASKLMRPMLEFCDDKHLLAYLETNKASNVGLYQHYGFDLMKEAPIPGSSVMHYAMVRNPKGE